MPDDGCDYPGPWDNRGQGAVMLVQPDNIDGEYCGNGEYYKAGFHTLTAPFAD
jgi:hypothetical protein